MSRHTIAPNGPLGRRPLHYQFADGGLTVGSNAETDASIQLDWYNDRLQILIYDGQQDEPALKVRLNPNGAIAEVIRRPDIVPQPHAHPTTAWEAERDEHPIT